MVKRLATRNRRRLTLSDYTGAALRTKPPCAFRMVDGELVPTNDTRPLSTLICLSLFGDTDEGEERARLFWDDFGNIFGTLRDPARCDDKQYMEFWPFYHEPGERHALWWSFANPTGKPKVKPHDPQFELAMLEEWGLVTQREKELLRERQPCVSL
jgi:hypothetical protein